MLRHKLLEKRTFLLRFYPYEPRSVVEAGGKGGGAVTMSFAIVDPADNKVMIRLLDSKSTEDIWAFHNMDTDKTALDLIFDACGVGDIAPQTGDRVNEKRCPAPFQGHGPHMPRIFRKSVIPTPPPSKSHGAPTWPQVPSTARKSAIPTLPSPSPQSQGHGAAR